MTVDPETAPCHNKVAMIATTIKAILSRRPFHPLEIRTNSGSRYVVQHPESAALLGGRLMVIYEPDGTVDWFEADAVSDIRRRNGRR